MAYTFRSKSTASVTMLRANGDELLHLIGRTPSERGVLSPEDIPTVIAAIAAAIEPRAAQAPRRLAEPATTDDEDPRDTVTLRQRALPFLALLEQARAAGEPVTWGVV